MKLPLFSYLLEKSKCRLKEFQVNQRAKASNNWKQAREHIDAAIEAEAHALFACWLEDYGEEFIEAARGDKGAAEAVAQPGTANVQDVTPAVPSERDRERPVTGREFWRTKRFYRRAG